MKYGRLVLLALVALATSPGAWADDAACSADADCTVDGEVCVLGTCQVDADFAGACTTVDDCNPFESCAVVGESPDGTELKGCLCEVRRLLNKMPNAQNETAASRARLRRAQSRRQAVPPRRPCPRTPHGANPLPPPRAALERT